MRLYIFLFLLVSAGLTGAVDFVSKGAIVNTEHTADSLLHIADDSFKLNKLDEAEQLYMKTYDVARDEFNRSVEVEALAQLARTYLKLKNKEEGLKYLKLATERANESDPMGWSRYLGVKGRFEWLADSLDGARKTFEQMYDFCKSNALWGRMVDAANMMAIVCEDPEEQIAWSYKGIEAAEASENESWLGPLWNNLAATYYDIKDYESALECYEKSREYHWRFSGETAKLYADYHIGMVLRYLGRFEEAGQWLRPVLAWAERIDNHSAIGQACEDLGEIAVASGNKADGLNYLKRARDQYKLAGFDESWQEIWEHINKRIKELE